MASRIEVANIKLPQHIEAGVDKVYDAAVCNEGGGYGRISSDLRKYFLDSVVDDESVHPVAKASLAASIGTSLVDVKDSGGKYHPLPATQRKLTGMRAFLGSMRPDSIVLLDEKTAARNTDNPQLVGSTFFDRDATYPHIQSRVTYQFADIARVVVGEHDPCDVSLSRGPYGAENGAITLDGTNGRSEVVLKYLTGVEQYSDAVVKKTINVGVSRDQAISGFITTLYDQAPEKNTSIAYPPNVLQAFGAAVAVTVVDQQGVIEIPVMAHEGVREEFREQISHAIVSLAMRQEHREGVSETNYCCPLHGNKTHFRNRQQQIAKWSVEQLGVTLKCLDLTIDDLIPEQNAFTGDSTIGEVVNDVINHEAVEAVLRDMSLRLAAVK